MIRLLAVLLVAAACHAEIARADTAPFAEPGLRARVLSHGPWPPPARPDRTNRLSGHPSVIALGAALFADARLSAGNGVACQTCHRPDHGWAEPLARSKGVALLDRNAPSLLDVRLNRWFGWDGASDSLWAASIRPILEPTEMGGSAAVAQQLLHGDRRYACLLREIGQDGAGDDPEAALVIAGKAIAAYLEGLASARTPFDDFRDALAAGDETAMERYPAPARRGLAIFAGQGRCSTCHSGPAFTNGEFHDIGLSFFVASPGRVDPGRHRGIAAVKASRFNLLGRYNDDPGGSASVPVRHVGQFHRNWGEFKVPGLRNLVLTAPYMHNGSKATLEDVVRHYSDLDEDRLHADGEAILRPLKLDAGGVRDLAAFLASLSPAAPPSPPQPPATACS